jgi:nucleoside-triphosphatase THEP1
MHRGKTPLASVQAGDVDSQENSPDQLNIITGPSGAGKSIWCLRAEAQARAAGLAVGGLISPAVYQNQQKVGISLIDLKTRERRQLATRKKTDQENSKCSWDFDERTIAWANQVLRATRPTEVLFIDELGPLELKQGEGLWEGLRLLDEGRYESAFVVVRPSLLSIARQRWPHMQLFHLKKQTR